jgi:hypothetical protein
MSQNLRMNHLPSNSASPAILVWIWLAALCLTPISGAQAQDPELSDVVFRTINATTGEPCTVDRLLLQESTMTMDEVGQIEPLAPVFQLDDVPLVDARAYIVTAWFQDVPYYWEFRGRFIDQDTNMVHVFSTTSETAGTVVSGMNLILKKQDSLVRLEYVLEVDNRISPQATVMNSTAAFELNFPSGAKAIEATYRQGLSQAPVETHLIGDNRLGLKLPLLPGLNRIRIQTTLEWRPNLEIPVGCNLPVEAWSLLGSPDYLEFTSFELEKDLNNTLPGVSRFVGPALEAGRELTIRVDSNPPPAPEGELFADSDSTAGAAETEVPRARRNPIPLPLLSAAAVLIILIAVLSRRRRNRS